MPILTPTRGMKPLVILLRNGTGLAHPCATAAPQSFTMLRQKNGIEKLIALRFKTRMVVLEPFQATRVVKH